MSDKVMIDAGEVGGGEPPAEESTDLKSQEAALENISTADLDKGLGIEPAPEAKKESAEEGASTLKIDEEGNVVEPEPAPKVEEAKEEVEEKAAVGGEELNELLQVLHAAGMDPNAKPTTLGELTQLLTQNVMDRQNRPQAEIDAEEKEAAEAEAQGKVKPGDPIDLKGFFGKYEDTLDAAYQPLYNDLANTISEQVMSRVAGQLPQAPDQDTDPGHLAFDLVMYNEAKNTAGDKPMPSFAEARQLVRATKGLMATTRFMIGKVGNTKSNPYTQVGDTWRAAKTPTGITNAQKAETEKGAKKVKIAKEMLSATPATRTKAKEFKDLSTKDQARALDKMDA